MPICPKCGEENPQLGAKCPRDEYYYVYEDAVALAESDARIGTISADKYVIVGRISKGGMGAVYRAIQMPVEREVAFKVLRTEMEESDQGRDRFVREARAISRLTHPNIITLHDFGFEKSGHPYMVMEYAPGMDMGDWLIQPNLALNRILHVTRQLLSALDEAHQEGIVHRDLKPENIIITPTSSDNDYVKLLDFGIARVIDETSTRGLTREGEVFGTPHYMSPEQAQGAKEVGTPADVYAVGIMLHEMLTGEAPFDAPTPLAVLLMHVNEPLPEMVARPGIEIPDELRAIVTRATDKDQNARYQNAAEMLGAIDAWMAQAGRFDTTGSFRAPIHTPTPAASSSHSGEVARPTLPSSPPAHDSGVHDRPTAQQGSSPGVHLQTGSFGSGVAVTDPDPSQVVHTSDYDFDDDATMPPGGQRRGLGKVGLVAAVMLFAIIGVAGAGFALLSDEEPRPATQDQDSAQIAEDEDPVNDGSDPTLAATQADDPTTKKDVTDPAEVQDSASEDQPTATTEAVAAEDSETRREEPAPPAEDKAPEETTKPAASKDDPAPKTRPTPKPARRDPPPRTRPDPKPEKTTPKVGKFAPTAPSTPPKEKLKEEPKEETKEKWGAPTIEQRKESVREDKW